MRIMALDYGERRIGVAVSDPTGVLAQPLATVPRRGRGKGHLDRIAELAKEYEVTRFVIGLPLHLDYDSRVMPPRRGEPYQHAESVVHRGVGNARRVVFDLPKARFGNRQNGLSDFRLRVLDVRTAIRRVEVRPVDR